MGLVGFNPSLESRTLDFSGVMLGLDFKLREGRSQRSLGA
jgi:hypothetical protein